LSEGDTLGIPLLWILGLNEDNPDGIKRGCILESFCMDVDLVEEDILELFIGWNDGKLDCMPEDNSLRDTLL